MTTSSKPDVWIALFRGINVGGNHILPMKDLRGLLSELGLINVNTYIQSGNAVFQRAADSTRTPNELAEQIAAAITTQHGFTPKVMVFSKTALDDATNANPFPEAAHAPKTLYVYFLDTAPNSPDWQQLEALKGASEHMKLVGNVFYLYAPDGISRSKLAAKAEKLLGVAATARNWRTVCKLADLAEAVSG
ncbi:MAG: DUF1697 domain-containing protein [Deinococcota bacterium]